jgi:hypothetical protein
MKLAKTFTLMIVGGVLPSMLLGTQRLACAQDAPDQGAWSAPEGADSDAKTVKSHPMDITGCWSGTVTDEADGTGTATLEIHQNGNLKKLVIGSTFNFEWGDGAMAKGPLKGSVTSTGFTFKGKAGATCAATGSGTGDDTALTGTVVFTGDCADLFQDVTFSIAPGC